MLTWDNTIDGRYQLDVELGRGGFGAVFKARQVVLGVGLRDVALKLFHEGAITPTNLLEKMNDAIALIGVLAASEDIEIRQHFIGVYDLGVSRDETPQAYVAMELVRGGSLEKKIKALRRFNARQTMDYLLQITKAVGFMHTCPTSYIHRDLKPDNVLLVPLGNRDLIKIADFGLAHALDGAMASSSAAGALQYMAPEGFEFETSRPASDVYSIGLMAVEMLFGEQPFARVGEGADMKDPKSRQAVYQAHIHSRSRGAEITPQQAAQTLDLANYPTLVEVLNRALAHNVTQRYANARLFHDDLWRVWNNEFPEVPPPTVEEAADPPVDPMARLQADVDYLLSHGRFGDATKAARQMVQLGPTLAKPYIALASIGVAQAESLPGDGTAANRERFLKKAAGAVLDHLDGCVLSQRAEMMRYLAGIYQKMGDTASAQRWLEKAAGEQGKGRP